MASFISVTRLAALAFTFVIADVARRFIRDRIERKGFPLPPGPTPLPFFGNLLSIDPKEPWLKYTEWQAKYGDIMYIRLLDADVIVLNTVKVARELLEKRSQIYSDRPFVATVEAYGYESNFAFSPYGEYWRLSRRIFHQMFHAEAALKLRPMQLRGARRMILNIIEDPERYSFHYATYTSAVAMSSVYGYEAETGNDPLVAMLDSFLDLTITMLTPEKSVLLKSFPFLLYVPDWFPGSSIKRESRSAISLRDRILDTTYPYIRKRMESDGNMDKSMGSEHVHRMVKLDDDDRSQYEFTLSHMSLASVIASTETTSSTILTFTLAMTKHPWAWKRAQEEIDAVIGLDRLPEFEDRESLPYITAIIRETFRWAPVNPLGLPHGSTESDIYEGFYIPKRATVFVNAWAMTRDKDRYPDPEAFLPERFLDARGQLTEDDPAEIVFGFGRRICPGRHLADASVWSALATMLATLEFHAPEDGVCEATFANGLTYHPVKFPCRLTPRAHITKEVLERILAM